MTFSPAWNALYEANRFGNGTASEFNLYISNFVHQHATVLELGCGTGVNIPQFLNKNADYYGIDGSEIAVAKALKNFPSLTGRITHGDFTQALGPYTYTDIICERASLPHNDIESITRCVALIKERLQVGGLFISSDWFSVSHSELKRGEIVEARTRRDYPDGQFLGAGTVHFSNEREIRELFDGWECICLIERLTRYVSPLNGTHWVSKVADGSAYTSAVFDMVWRKV